MAYIYSSNEQAAAVAAGNAAADGQREATYLASWQAALGVGPTLALYRDSVKVWSASISGSLPIDGSSFVVPTTVTTISIADADIDTGTWEFRVENTANADVYIGAGVTKLGATDVLALSADIDDATVLAVGEIAFYAPTLDTVTQVISRNDSRVVMWCDPNYTFANQLHGYTLQVSDANFGASCYSVSEPGIIGSGATYTLSRVTSPYSDGTAFLHRIDPAFPLWGGTQRSQMHSGSIKLLDDTVYWVGYEFSVESSWATDGEGANFSILDIHHDNWTQPTGNQAPIALFGYEDRTIGLALFGNYANSLAVNGGIVGTIPAVTAGQRVRVIIKFRLGRSWASNPFCQAWYQVEAGAETMFVDTTAYEIGYLTMPANQCFAKFGLYYWTPSGSVRTTYTKGMVVLRDEGGTPTLSSATMFDLVQSL